MIDRSPVIVKVVARAWAEIDPDPDLATNPIMLIIDLDGSTDDEIAEVAAWLIKSKQFVLPLNGTEARGLAAQMLGLAWEVE